MKCTICGKHIVLEPSAAARAKRYGGVPGDYEKLFTTHSECAIKKRNDETVDLMRRINAERKG